MIVGNKILPLIDEPPSFDIETQYLETKGFDVKEDKVIKIYEVIDIPESSNMEEERIQALEDMIMFIMTTQLNEGGM